MLDWEFKEISGKLLDEQIKSKEISIPAYQRGIVWTNDKQEQLIESIKKGFPFGSILIYEKDNKKRQLIDGLQRCYTIFKFMNTPTKFFNYDDIDEDAIRRIHEEIGNSNSKESSEEKLRVMLIEWVKTHITLDSVTKMQFSDFSDLLVEKFPSAKPNQKKINNLLKPMLGKYQGVCQSLSNVRIPALIYHGAEENLPVIFEKINSEGSKLSKFQIYSAAWHDKRIKIKDPKLIDLIKYNTERYDELTKGEIEVDDYDASDFKKRSEANLFEIGFGMSKILKNKFPHLFGSKSSKIEIDSCGFNLINLCLGRKFSEMGTLNKYIFEKNIDENIEVFLTRIIDTVDYVDTLLSEYLKFKSNIRSYSEVKTLHSEMQIISIIASIFNFKYLKFKYDEDYNVDDVDYDFANTSPEWKTYKNKFKDNLIKYYTSDILLQKWKGSGDSKAEDLAIRNQKYYSYDFLEKDFRNLLQSWYEQDKKERNESKRIADPKEKEKLLLNIIYSPLLSALDHLNGSKYDFEHLCPKNKMKKVISKFGDDFYLPISSIANISLLPESVNRSKTDKTIYEDNRLKDKLLEIETKYTFTKKTDLDFLDDTSLSKTSFKIEYMNFLNNRFALLVDKIISSMYKIWTKIPCQKISYVII